MTGNEPIFWTSSAATALTVIAGLVATRVRREWLTSLPMAHVAAAVLIALFGWESVVYLPSTIQVYTAGVAGIPNPANVEAYQVFMVASAAFVVAAGFAVYGVLRLKPWGLVLGLGVAATRVAMTLASAVSLFSIEPDPFGPGGLAWNVLDLVALRALPAVAAIVLLLWPLRRASTTDAPPAETAEWGGEPSPEAGR